MSDFDLAFRALEYVILVTALSGALLSAYVLADYVGDRLDLQRDGDYRLTANIGIRTSAMIALTLVVSLGYAIYGIVGPLPTPGREVRGLVNLGVFEAIVLTLTVLKFLNLRDRIRLRTHK